MPPSETAGESSEDGRLVWLDTPSGWKLALRNFTAAPVADKPVILVFAAMGAPWHYGIDDLEAVAAEAGLTVADRVTIGALHRKFWPERPPASIIYDHYTVCTLASEP